MEHRFVEHIPEIVADGVLYISTTYATAIHRCACGCGSEVVTPLSPAAWRLTYDGETVSLFPSIGNWSFPCQSHYWIWNGQIEWARRWTAAEITEGRDRDRAAREALFDRSRIPAAVRATADPKSKRPSASTQTPSRKR